MKTQDVSYSASHTIANVITKNIEKLWGLFSPVQTRIVSSEDTASMRIEMLHVYSQYYKVDPRAFFNRFASNDYYAVYRYKNRLIGFTGLRIREIETQYGPAQTLYVGQTVMDAAFRGKSLIPRTCIRLFAQLMLANPLKPMYIWCDALTFKPYVLFANSVTEFYPTYKEDTPEKVKAVIDGLGKQYYKEKFDPERGTVYKEKNVIEDASAIISPAHKENPHIDFYAKANPNHHKGHGLLIIAPINMRNLLYLVQKCMRKMLKK